MTRNQLPEVCQAGINISFDDAGKTVEDIAARIFGVKKMTDATYKSETISGPGLMRKKGEGSPGSFDEITRGNPFQLTPGAFQLGFNISREMKDDNKVDLWGKMATFLGISAKESMQVSASLFLGRSFGALVAASSWPTNASTTDTSSKTQTYVGADGVSLFSASHPVEGNVATWGGISFPVTYSNLLEAAMTETTIGTGISMLRRMPNMRGLPAGKKVGGICAPPSLELTMNQIIHSQATTLSTQANPYSAGVQSLISGQGLASGSFTWDHAIDPDDWFLFATDIKDHLSRGERDVDSPLEYDYDTNKKVYTVDVFRRWAHGNDGLCARSIIGSFV